MRKGTKTNNLWLRPAQRATWCSTEASVKQNK